MYLHHNDIMLWSLVLLQKPTLYVIKWLLWTHRELPPCDIYPLPMDCRRPIFFPSERITLRSPCLELIKAMELYMRLRHYTYDTSCISSLLMGSIFFGEKKVAITSSWSLCLLVLTDVVGRLLLTESGLTQRKEVSYNRTRD